MITVGTYHKVHILDTPEKLSYMTEQIFQACEENGWSLQAWVIISNHYHLVVHCPEDEMIKKVIQRLNGRTSRYLNQLDNATGRKVWYSYWQTHLTFQNSYFARLAYVHRNPVKHGLVKDSLNYPWCSAKWLYETGDAAWANTIMSFDTSEVNVEDDF